MTDYDQLPIGPSRYALSWCERYGFDPDTWVARHDGKFRVPLHRIADTVRQDGDE
jgi:hypothetical protein